MAQRIDRLLRIPILGPTLVPQGSYELDRTANILPLSLTPPGEVRAGELYDNKYHLCNWGAGVAYIHEDAL